jgi:parallel beta-helix repeat protein
MIAAKADVSMIRVPNDFPTIQEAINAAQNGSTILVESGVYFEHVTINKTLTLSGADKEDTIIDGSNSGTVITVTADNVVINGFTVRNSSYNVYCDGIILDGSAGSIITDNIVTLNGWAGIELSDSSNDTISGNIVSSTIGSTQGFVWGDGIQLSYSPNNTISNNLIIFSSEYGVNLGNSNNNSIFGNTIWDNQVGVWALSSRDNTIFDNNFIDNGEQAVQNDTNAWSYGGRGNYWNDYAGLDDGSGGRVAGDGVGDTGLPWDGVDYFPLINPVNPLPIFYDNTVFPVSLVSNSTIFKEPGAEFPLIEPNGWFMFEVVGPANTTGYLNLTIPKTLLSGPWQVRLDGWVVQADISENQTDTTISLNYSNNSYHHVFVQGTDVVSEYPTATVLPLLTLAAITLLTVLASKKRKNSKQHSFSSRKLRFSLKKLKTRARASDSG